MKISNGTLENFHINFSIKLAALWVVVILMPLMARPAVSRWAMFYTFLGLIEIIMTSLVIWYAWRWPKH